PNILRDDSGCSAEAATSRMGPGCVKTCASQACPELFSQLPSSDRSCQCNWFLHRRNRDGNSTHKLGVGVFTQPGSFSDLSANDRDVRSTPINRHHEVDVLRLKSAHELTFGADLTRRFPARWAGGRDGALEARPRCMLVVIAGQMCRCGESLRAFRGLADSIKDRQ